MKARFLRDIEQRPCKRTQPTSGEGVEGRGKVRLEAAAHTQRLEMAEEGGGGCGGLGWTPDKQTLWGEGRVVSQSGAIFREMT